MLDVLPLETGLYIFLVLALVAIGFPLLVRWGMYWSSTPEERCAPMPGDTYLEGGPPSRVAMTRAVSICARPESVWPWLAQLGRGAGWYSIDWLDNGGKVSARHVVSWIPPPELGDASAIGYLRHIEPVRELVWWSSGTRFFRARSRLAVDFRLTPEGEGSRLVVRWSADAQGPTATVALLVFRVIDSIMAHRQLSEIRRRVELYGRRSTDPEEPETGAKDQYQFYEVVYRSGKRAGVPGQESAPRWHQSAIHDGLISEATNSGEGRTQIERPSKCQAQ